MTIQVGKVGMIPLESITVVDRTRQEMGDLDVFEANLKETGLISPLAVKDNKDGTYRLLAGERRYTVLKRNQVSSIPVRIYEQDLSNLEMKVIEKAENFNRKDMEYWELDQLTKEIHQESQQLHGVKAPGPGQEGHGTRDTANIIGVKSPATVVESIKRAEAREAFPELFETCKSASDASKVLKKVDEAIVRQSIAQKLGAQKFDSNLRQLSKCFIVKDFFEGVKEIPDNIMHLVEVDPPYAIKLGKRKEAYNVSQYIFEDYKEISVEYYMDGDPDGPWRGINKLFQDCYRVMTQHSWLLCWFSMEPWFEQIYHALIKAGFSTTRNCAIWTKGISGQTLNPSKRLGSSYDTFFYAQKGQPVLNKAGHGNEFKHSPIPPNQKTHPAERPIELTTEIYETFAFPGSRVLIPFLGSGNGLFSAHELKMDVVGFELSKAHKDSFLVKAHGMG